jgi:hypothetical protein
MAQASKVSAAVRANREYERAVAQADDWVHELLGKWAESKTWEWDVRPDPSGQPFYDFRMVYQGASAADRFDRFEVANKRVFTERVSALWGRVIDDALAQERATLRGILANLTAEVAVAH